jgi:hypothetical protein
MVLGERAVPRGVSYRQALEWSLGAVVTLEPASRRAVGLDAVSYLPAVVVKPVAVSYRSLVPSELRDGMLGMDDKVGGKSGRGLLGDDADEITTHRGAPTGRNRDARVRGRKKLLATRRKGGVVKRTRSAC